ncbi:MAG: class I SAM-dependent methyltransferase [Candidatus Nitrosotenuis sp.]
MVNSHSNSIEYKRRLIKTWNEIAPRYHKRWAKEGIGAFQSTTKLVTTARLGNGDRVLDLACGTGAVTKKILKKIGKGGHVIGVDSSSSAIKIAKKWASSKNVDFVVSDAENLHFNEKFDVITCQYALFFFPNASKVLQNVKHCLKKSGTLALAVHGAGDSVPYFSSILDVVTKFISDYIPLGAPDLDRFGTKVRLKKAITDAGFTNIKIKEFVFSYSPGTFSRYWNDYLKYLAKPLREKIDRLPHTKQSQMREQIAQKTLAYTKNGKITFPWKVLMLTATKP